MSYSDLLGALENIIDMVATVPTVRNKKIDTSAPMQIGMAAKKEINESWISRCRLCTKEQAMENEAFERVRVGMKKDIKVAKVGEKTCGRRAGARKEAQDRRKVAREQPEHVGLEETQDTLQRGVEKVATSFSTLLM